MPANTALKLVSLFSGAGGLDIGLAAAGFETIFANDIEPNCCETLRNNLRGNVQVVCGDIQELSGAKILKSIGMKRGGIPLLAGGPPCQAFSVFGQRKGRNDARGRMVYEYFRLLDEIAPKAFVFENVFGLLSVEHGEVFKIVKERLENPSPRLHYDISVFRLDAVNYGVPQYRDRIIIIGSRNGRKVSSIPEITPEHPSNTQFQRRTVKDALSNLPAPNPTYPSNHTGRKHSARIIARYASLKPGERDHHTRINKLDVSKPSFTIICGSDHGGGKGHVHPIEPREVTPRESARIQTFPDDWAFEGHGRVAIRQVGNAVPPLLAFAIGNAIRAQVFDLPLISFQRGISVMHQEHLFPELFKGGKQ